MTDTPRTAESAWQGTEGEANAWQAGYQACWHRLNDAGRLLSAEAATPPDTRLREALYEHRPTVDCTADDGHRIRCRCGRPDTMDGWWAHLKLEVIEPLLQEADTAPPKAADHYWVGDHGVATGGNVSAPFTSTSPHVKAPSTPALDVERLARALRDPIVQYRLHAYSYTVGQQAEAIAAAYASGLEAVEHD